MEKAYRRVVYQCREVALQSPARSSVLKRIRALDAHNREQLERVEAPFVYALTLVTLVL
jgi:hypothetical protein